MHIIGRANTTGGFNTRGARSGGGMRINRLMKSPTKGSGMSEEFYSNSTNMSDKSKVYAPENIRKFNKVKISSSKPKNYITF